MAEIASTILKIYSQNSLILKRLKRLEYSYFKLSRHPINCQQLTVAAESANLDKVSNVDKTFDATDCLTQINKDDKSVSTQTDKNPKTLKTTDSSTETETQNKIDIPSQTDRDPQLDKILYDTTSWLTQPALPVLTSRNKTLIYNVMNFLKDVTGSHVKLVNHSINQNLKLTLDTVTNASPESSALTPIAYPRQQQTQENQIPSNPVVNDTQTSQSHLLDSNPFIGQSLQSSVTNQNPFATPVQQSTLNPFATKSNSLQVNDLGQNTFVTSNVPFNYAEKAKGVLRIDTNANDSFGYVKSTESSKSVDHNCKNDISTSKKDLK